MISYSCEGSKLVGVCVIVISISLPVTEPVCVSLGRDILNCISATLISYQCKYVFGVKLWETVEVSPL